MAVPTDSIALAVDMLDRYAGPYQYEGDPDQDVVITLESGQLFYFQNVHPALRLHATSDTTFYIWPLQTTLRFELNDDNHVSRLAITYGETTNWLRPIE